MNNQKQIQPYERRIQNIQSHLITNKNDQNILDCIVIGGGITGSSSAYQMAKDGLKVLMLEQFDQGNDKASSHGDGRIIRFSYPEDVYIELAKLTYPLWREIEKESNSKLIHITGGLDFGVPNSKALLDLIESYKKNNIDYQIFTKQEAELKFPQFKFSETDLIVYQKDSGVAYATKSVKTLWTLAKRFGAQTIDNKRVSRIKVESEQLITVLCEDQTVYKCKKIVLACGGWINKILTNSQLNLTLPLELTQEKVFYWEPKPTTPTNIDYTQYSNPVSIYYDEVDIYYSLPQIDIRGVKIGYHHSGPVLTNMDQPIKPEFKEKDLNKIKNFVGNYMPGLINEKEYHSIVCHYTNTSDWHFIIDKHPRFQNVIIASPCSGHGFKFGPAIGKLISHLAQDKPCPIGPTPEFSIKRFSNPGQFAKRISA